MSRLTDFMEAVINSQKAVVEQAKKYGYEFQACSTRWSPSPFPIKDKEKWGGSDLILVKGKREISVTMSWEYNKEKGWHCVRMFVWNAPASDGWVENPHIFSFHTPAGAVAVLRQFFNDWQFALVKVG